MLIGYTKAAVFARKVDRLVEQGQSRLGAIESSAPEDVFDVRPMDEYDLDAREDQFFSYFGVNVLKFKDLSGFLWCPDESGDDVEHGYYGIVPYVNDLVALETSCKWVWDGYADRDDWTGDYSDNYKGRGRGGF